MRYTDGSVTVTVVIPVQNGAGALPRCLAALQRSTLPPFECIVIDDASTDGSAEYAAAVGATVIRMEHNGGPAAARNLGVARSSGDVVVFVDCDVCVHADTLARIQARFDAEPDLAALIGSYDDQPDAPNFISQYKNLVNHYFHQSGRPEATTFWSACGAIRREAFLAVGGFDESYPLPSIEDIELGYRLRRAGRRIALDHEIQVQHLKRWTLGSMLRSDIFERALPWTRLILESGRLPNDLNVAISQRFSALLAWTSAALGAAGLASPVLLAPAALSLVGVLGLNRRLFKMLKVRKGLGFAAAALPLYLGYYLYSSVAFGAGMMLSVAGWHPRAALRQPALAKSNTRAGAAL